MRCDSVEANVDGATVITCPTRVQSPAAAAAAAVLSPSHKHPAETLTLTSSGSAAAATTTYKLGERTERTTSPATVQLVGFSRINSQRRVVVDKVYCHFTTV